MTCQDVLRGCFPFPPVWRPPPPRGLRWAYRAFLYSSTLQFVTDFQGIINPGSHYYIHNSISKNWGYFLAHGYC